MTMWLSLKGYGMEFLHTLANPSRWLYTDDLLVNNCAPQLKTHHQQQISLPSSTSATHDAILVASSLHKIPACG
jgi:hypothetical protein